MRTRSMAAATAALLLAGCAGTGGEPGKAARSGYRADVDWALVHAVTEDAERRGYKVVWVNLPQRKKPDKPAPR